tara:strand:- start:33 stop:206 length:174 start_codon:yes stop_codon:yes gene_type:complete
MEIILEILVEIIFVLILGYPGAFVRWGFGGFKKGGFKRAVKEDAYVNFGYLLILKFK